MPPPILRNTQGIAFVDPLRHTGGDLVFDGQVFLIPVGLHFVHIQPRIVIEGKFQRAPALPTGAAPQAILVVALLVAVQLNSSSCSRRSLMSSGVLARGE